MKYIFRYTILSKFPHPDNKITQAQLQQALHSVKFQFDKYNILQLEQICVNCIQKILSRPNQKVVGLIQDVFGSENNNRKMIVPEFNSKELETIWQQQKVNIYKSILQNSCHSSQVYKDLQWSVKNIIMRRGQSLNKGNNLLTRLKINLLQNPQAPSEQATSLTVNMNKKGVEIMYNSLVECQNAINEILLSEE